ncbi:hypothetical protein HPB52_018793 [Rhipicephalus sanguineus]|uniref:Uncharacterized protein n=1 Tax=Rhipicephalus sanguineus TaxID=34632 RepID=A0A9D4SUZ1_RHISA|nr:hypothetical protein HPB52_018793 [Rhipicephalus sanguineus]
MTVMDSDSASTTGKRAHDAGKNEKGPSAAATDEPPAKTTPARRALLRPRPNIPTERKTAETPPLPPTVVLATAGGSASTDTHKLSEIPQHSTSPVITPSVAEPVPVEQEAVPVEADEAAEFQVETSGSGDDMSVTTATLKRARDETEEMDKTSSTTSEEPPAKTPQGRRFTLRPEPKISTDKRPADKTKQKNAGKQDGPGGG